MTLTNRIRTLRLALLVALVALVVPGALSAQDVYDNTIVAKVPFPFVAGGTTLPAGTYQVDAGPAESDQAVLVIQTATESKDELNFKKVFTMAIPTKDVKGDDKPKLVFKRVGDLYFLDKVIPTVGRAKEIR